MLCISTSYSLAPTNDLTYIENVYPNVYYISNCLDQVVQSYLNSPIWNFNLPKVNWSDWLTLSPYYPVSLYEYF